MTWWFQVGWYCILFSTINITNCNAVNTSKTPCFYTNDYTTNWIWGLDYVRTFLLVRNGSHHSQVSITLWITFTFLSGIVNGIPEILADPVGSSLEYLSIPASNYRLHEKWYREKVICVVRSKFCGNTTECSVDSHSGPSIFSCALVRPVLCLY